MDLESNSEIDHANAMDRMRAEITRLRAALKAFAEESADVAPNYDNARLAILLRDGTALALHLTVQDLRVAALIFNHQ